MKASDLDKVTTLLQDLSMARITLRDFEAIPENAEQFLLQTSWPNPEPDPPPHRQTKHFSVRLDPAADAALLRADVENLLGRILQARVSNMEQQLRALGVDPTL